MTEFIMLVGLPGCGKSYLANEYAKKGYIVHSSDAIRDELTGNEETQDNNQEVFNLLHKRIKEDLRNGKSCVYDATNISYKRRKAFVQELAKIDCFKQCIFIATPYEVCLNQNDMRERHVPEYVIERMYRNFDPPAYYEGWDNITIHYNDEKYKKLYGGWGTFLYDTLNYDQENPHHENTLGNHCKACAEYIVDHFNKEDKEQFWNVYMAATLHDCGKPFCKTYKNTKGEIDTQAHYYNHECVGAYNCFFYDLWNEDVDRQFVAVLIRWHMQMWFIKKQPHTEEKYRKLFGEDLWNVLVLLNKADRAAH